MGYTGIMFGEGMIYGALLLWYILTVGAIIFTVYDFTFNTPMMGVMKLAWFLILLYTGPVGLFLYLLTCRQALPGTHDAYIKPHWKQSIGSMMHCIAGDATGIILAASIVYAFGLPNGIDLVLEYTAAFVVGLLIFQAVFMLGMYNNNYLLAVRKTFFAEFVSMNMVMVGMFPVMLLLMHELPGADNPFDARFWGVMSIATMAAMVTAYPINSWMVRAGIKHGMMSAPEPGKDGGMEGMDMGPKKADDKPMEKMAGMDHGSHAGHEGHKMEGMDHSSHESHAMEGMKHEHSGHDMKGMEHEGHGNMPEHAGHMAHEMKHEHGGHQAHGMSHGGMAMAPKGESSHSEHAGHEMPGISLQTMWIVGAATFAAMILAIFLVSFIVPIRFS